MAPEHHSRTLPNTTEAPPPQVQLPVVGADQQDVAVHGGVVGGDAADGDEELRLRLRAVLLVLQRRKNLSQRPGRQHAAARAAFNLQHVGTVDHDALRDGLDLHRRGHWDEARGDGGGGHRRRGQRGRLHVLHVLVVALHFDDVVQGHLVRGAELLGFWSALDPHDGRLAEGDASAGRVLRLVVLHFDETAVKGEVVDRLLEDGLIVALHHRPREIVLARVEAGIVGQQRVITGRRETWVSNSVIRNKNWNSRHTETRSR